MRPSDLRLKTHKPRQASERELKLSNGDYGGGSVNSKQRAIIHVVIRATVSAMGKLGHCSDLRCKTALAPKAQVHPRSCFVAQVISDIARSPRRRGRAVSAGRRGRLPLPLSDPQQDRTRVPAAGCPVEQPAVIPSTSCPVCAARRAETARKKKMAPWAPRLMLMSGSLGRRAATLRLSKCFAAAAPHFANVKRPVACAP
jgi:hypothetical protein